MNQARARAGLRNPQASISLRSSLASSESPSLPCSSFAPACSAALATAAMRPAGGGSATWPSRAARARSTTARLRCWRPARATRAAPTTAQATISTSSAATSSMRVWESARSLSMASPTPSGPCDTASTNPGLQQHGEHQQSKAHGVVPHAHEQLVVEDDDEQRQPDGQQGQDPGRQAHLGRQGGQFVARLLQVAHERGHALEHLVAAAAEAQGQRDDRRHQEQLAQLVLARHLVQGGVQVLARAHLAVGALQDLQQRLLDAAQRILERRIDAVADGDQAHQRVQECRQLMHHAPAVGLEPEVEVPQQRDQQQGCRRRYPAAEQPGQRGHAQVRADRGGEKARRGFDAGAQQQLPPGPVRDRQAAPRGGRLRGPGLARPQFELALQEGLAGLAARAVARLPQQQCRRRQQRQRQRAQEPGHEAHRLRPRIRRRPRARCRAPRRAIRCACAPAWAWGRMPRLTQLSFSSPSGVA